MTQHDNLYCKYSIVSGQDWTLVSGLEEGVTQISKKPKYLSSLNSVNAFNFPVEVAFKSTNAYGWPQIVLSVYGPDFLGRDVVRGYGCVHLPRSSGKHVLYIPLFVPLATSPINHFLSLIAGKMPEFIDPKFVSKSEGREGKLKWLLIKVTRVKSHGTAKVQLYVSTKDFDKFGYKNE